MASYLTAGAFFLFVLGYQNEGKWFPLVKGKLKYSCSHIYIYITPATSNIGPNLFPTLSQPNQNLCHSHNWPRGGIRAVRGQEMGKYVRGIDKNVILLTK